MNSLDSIDPVALEMLDWALVGPKTLEGKRELKVEVFDMYWCFVRSLSQSRVEQLRKTLQEAGLIRVADTLSITAEGKDFIRAAVKRGDHAPIAPGSTLYADQD